jgi:protein-L-isoaspartate(D-aspartate) O-methyltransferase
MVDVARQRTNMVESQVMTSDVTDHRILRALRELPRERFVPASLADLAYMDEAVPITPPGAGKDRRYLLSPRVLAKLLQLADIGDEDHVLDIGCGSGYSAAVLAKIARRVVALECSVSLAEDARRTLAGLGLTSVAVEVGELAAGYSAGAPYDAIVLGGSIERTPDELLDQLKDGGRLVAVVRHQGLGKATIWRRLGRSFDQWEAFDAAAPPLPGFEIAAAFAL